MGEELIHSETMYRADVMSATAVPGPLSIIETSQQMAYCEIIPELFQDGSETSVPIPNELFDAIIHINHLRAILGNPGITEEVVYRGDIISLKRSISALLQRIISFSMSQWADRMVSRYKVNTNRSVPAERRSGFIDPGKDGWLQIARAYHAATVIYCVRSLALDNTELVCTPQTSDQSAQSYVSITDIHLVAKQTLFKTLKVLASHKADEPFLGKLVTWPFFVAGIEAATDSDATEVRQVVSSSLLYLSILLGALNLRDTRSFLMNLWSQTCDRGEHGRQRWSDLLQDVQGRCAYFM